MSTSTANPYRTDYPGAGSFYGRAGEMTGLVEAMRTGRQSLAAVMGGRGMGKTSLALRVHQTLSSEAGLGVHIIRKAAADPADFFGQIAVRLGARLDVSLPVESMVEAVRKAPSDRVVLLIDEIDGLLGTEQGRSLVESLRIAWEELSGELGLAVLGGSALRRLLAQGNSPFLRAARWIPLKGLSRDEAAALIREPMNLDVTDTLVEVLWEQTGGHPFLLQATLERAAALGGNVVERLPEALGYVAEERLSPTLFPIWWDNLGELGQEVYRALLAHPKPLERHEQASILGKASHASIELLETTGVARLHNDQLLPRCELFRAWVEENHPRSSSGAPLSDRKLPEMLRASTPAPLYPAFVTRHESDAGRPLRVYHFLLQLPEGDA